MFKMSDASGNYDWVVEGLNPSDYAGMSDDELGEIAEFYIEQRKPEYIQEVREAAKNKVYPMFAATTADILNNEDEYVSYVLADMEAEIQAERASIVAHFKSWIKGAEESPTLEITLPNDMLWVDADPAQFRVKETEQAFIDQFSRLLSAEGYKAEITFALVASTKIEDEDGYVDDDRLWEIYTILDRVDPEYIKAEAADADADADSDES